MKSILSFSMMESANLILFFFGLFLGSLSWHKNLNSVFKSIGVAAALGLMCFLPSKRGGSYALEEHLNFYPYFVSAIWVIVNVVVGEKVRILLHEGNTMVLSLITFFYLWYFEFWDFKWFFLFLSLVLISLCIFSLVHAFSYITITAGQRLLLSIWSSLSYVIIGVINIILIFNSPKYHESFSVLDSSYSLLKYFILGVTITYFGKHAEYLFSLFPNKYDSYNVVLKEAEEKHLKRYSKTQVPIFLNFVIMILVISLLIWNNKMQFMEINILAWMILIIYPILFQISNQKVKV
jgi:hypothetical protein